MCIVFVELFKVFNITKYLSKVYNKLSFKMHFERFQLIIINWFAFIIYLLWIQKDWALKTVKIKNENLSL